ncbi:MAG: hypothetical protein ABUL48_02570 [Pseudorhodoplanes sp.]
MEVTMPAKTTGRARNLENITDAIVALTNEKLPPDQLRAAILKELTTDFDLEDAVQPTPP